MERPKCQGKTRRGTLVCPCERSATVERDGKWYCWQHDPHLKSRARRRGEREANARLADAAPALVAALEGVAVMLNTELREYDAEPWAQRVRTALALAKGEQP